MIEAGSPGTTRWLALVGSAAALLLSACSSGGHAAAAAHRPVTTAPKATTTSILATTTTAAPTTTMAPTTVAPTTAAPTTVRPVMAPAAPPPAPPATTPHPYASGPSSTCSSYGPEDLPSGQAASFNVQLTQYWTSGPTETAGDANPYVPPVTLHLVGTRGTHFTVRIYWDPTQPSHRIPPGKPGAWMCDAELG